ncbi:hypothetical protein B5X24_HaOG214608 [Helicoverpa armigera]|uniref:Reverse transcriptase domain-containing protein n=1 Tax=Helicoverpa armigera TaxID=29058 RepID=A0A2W1B274_HELAM|nr:hypothetical protein B5X24_HaOG214608 [Helicoverpa armigera]
MITRAASRRNVRPPPPESSLSSASPPPDPGPPVIPAAAAASSSSDEYFSPPTSPPPVRRQGRRRPPTGLGSGDQQVPSRVPATGGCVQRMRWTQKMNENVMRAYYGSTEGGTNLTAYRDRMLSLFQVLEPAVNVSAQRLSDQVRVIQRNHRLDDAALDRLRLEMLGSPMVTTSSQAAVPPPPPGEITPRSDLVERDEDDRVETVSTQCNEQVRSALEDAILEFRYSPVESRPRLPRLPMHRQNRALVCALDSLLEKYFENSEDLLDTHSIMYCAAVAACRVANVKFPDKDRATRPKLAVPAWQCRIERRIEGARVLIGKLYCFREGNTRPRVMRFVRRAFVGTRLSPHEYMSRVTERIDFLRQKVCAWASRIRRYKRRVERYTQNRMFQSDQRWVYRTWEQPEQCVMDGSRPDDDATNMFWRNLWSTPVCHEEGDWTRDIERECEKIPEMEEVNITSSDVAYAVRPMQNWKSPGPDGLHNFWLKWLQSSHPCLASQFQSSLEAGSLPQFLTTGITHLLHKSELQLMKLLKVTETFSSCIRMEFGVDKCAVMHVKRGGIVKSEEVQLSDSINLRSLSANDTYKYLGMAEGLGINVAVMKQSLRERFFGRLNKVLKSSLSGGNKVRAFNGWVMPVLMYSFGILKWTQTELDALDRKVRTLLTAERMHHPRSSVMRLYIPRKCGGRGFLNAKTLHNREVCSLREYFLKSDVASRGNYCPYQDKI